MLGSTISEKAGLAASILQVEASRLHRVITRPLRVFSRLRQSVPERLLIAPQDIRTADPTIAGDIYAGHLVFGGSFVDAHGQSPFEVAIPNSAWAEDLHGFGWLRHLRAANTALARANARALVEDWIVHGETVRGGLAWHPEVVTRRLLSWLSQSPIILDPPDAAFYRKFMKSIGRQAAFLQRTVLNGLGGERRLFAAIALAEVGLCADGLPGIRKQGSRTLIDELTRQILPDGGHISRDPGVLVGLLLDLLPLRQAYAARSAPVPPALLNAIDRIMPMLRMFRHGDGALALFNGMSVTEPDVLATVLTYDDARTRPLTNAPHSGYQRLEAGPSLLICDVGKPPVRAFSEHAHAGTLSFEFSVASQRLIVNCGRPDTRSRLANSAARSTAAHSTLVLADASSGRFATPRLHRWLGQQLVAGPRSVPLTRESTPEALVVEASHDGYARRFGLLHRRRLALSRSGERLDGQDHVLPLTQHRRTPAAQPFVIRFHLHPAIRADVVRNGEAALLTLPSGERWLFEAGGTMVRVEESILFAVAEGPRRTAQLVVAGGFPERASIAWSLTRIVP